MTRPPPPHERTSATALAEYDAEFYDDDGVFYPETDERGMPEGDAQFDYISYAVMALRRYFKHQPEVYVSGDLFIYYQKGDPSAAVAPDLFVVFGVVKRLRPSYMVWREGKVPAFVVEVTSKATRARDKRDKLALYEWLGVEEYFQYDPTGTYLQPALRGYRLDEQGRYRALPGQGQGGGSVRVASRVLGLELHLEGERLRLFNPRSGSYLRSYEEAEEQLEAETRARQQAEAAARDATHARQQAEERASQESHARQQAEAEIAALRAELERVRSGSASET